MVDELLESNLFSSSSSLPSTSTTPLTSLADDIDSLLPRKSDNERSISVTNVNFLRDTGRLFQFADEVLATLFSIVLSSSSELSSSLSTPSTLNRQSRLARIIKELEDYSRDFEDVQSTDMGGQLGYIQDYIVGAVDDLRKASKGIQVLEESVTTVTQVLEKIKTCGITWEMLAKKHQCLKVY